MPRYFFHIRDGQEFDRDTHGIDLESAEAAKREAILGARGLLTEHLSHGRPLDGQCFEIEDDAGHVIAIVPFKEAYRD